MQLTGQALDIGRQEETLAFGLARQGGPPSAKIDANADRPRGDHRFERRLFGRIPAVGVGDDHHDAVHAPVIGAEMRS